MILRSTLEGWGSFHSCWEPCQLSAQLRWSPGIAFGERERPYTYLSYGPGTVHIQRQDALPECRPIMKGQSSSRPPHRIDWLAHLLWSHCSSSPPSEQFYVFHSPINCLHANLPPRACFWGSQLTLHKIKLDDLVNINSEFPLHILIVCS